VIKNNQIKSIENEEALATILVDLFFIQDGSVKQRQGWIKYTMGLNKFMLLWTILQKSKNSQNITINDVFTILAAILDCQVKVLINLRDTVHLIKTSNPLLFRQKDTKNLIFLSFNDL
jgi:hypothetical protein